ncbi:GH25 family lysozyme [Streptomyces jumonjinensis]|uniref:GH25 family lysozyme n=1 Tax=Streptomyces jumonjinensis TaxID=1945 RepID=UPI003799ED45
MRKHVRNAVLQALAVSAIATGTYTAVNTNGEEAQAHSPSVYSVKGIDTSHHNAHPIRWASVKAAGYSFVFQKATQGTGFRDPRFAADFADASRAGLMAAPYHFYDSGSGAAQASHFIRTVRAAGYDGRRPGQLPPVVDLEKIKGRCPAGVNSTQVGAFLTQTRRAFGVNPIVYTSRDFTDSCLGGRTAVLANSPLWQPRYRSGTREPAPIGGRSWSIWQHTEHGSVPGMRGNVDLNVYKGTLTQLRALAHLGPVPGRPVPPGGTTNPAPAPGSASWPLVKTGHRGTDVRTAQHLLAAAGHRLDADGVFGPATAGATRAFQQRHGLAVDGIIGPDTWNKLIRTVSPGSRGPAVKAAQLQLTAAGHRLDADGVFGPATAAATKAFQQRNRLAVDGITGPNTWNKLVNGTREAAPAPSRPAAGTPAATGTLTHTQATRLLRTAGIDWVSTGRCSDRNRRSCTSFDGVRAHSINGMVALKKLSGCPVTITGATETGHAPGKQSHGTGHKIDVRPTPCVDAFITRNSTFSYHRGDGPVRTGAIGGIKAQYARESDHWDITFL